MVKSKRKAVDIRKQRDPFNHRPFLVKFYSLLSVFVLTLGLIAALELTGRKLPKVSKPAPLKNGLNKTENGFLDKRQQSAPSNTTASPTPADNLNSTAPTATNSVDTLFVPVSVTQTLPAQPCASGGMNQACGTFCANQSISGVDCIPTCLDNGLIPASCRPSTTVQVPTGVTVQIVDVPAANTSSIVANTTIAPPPCGFDTSLTMECFEHCIDVEPTANPSDLRSTCPGLCEQAGIPPNNPAPCISPAPVHDECGYSQFLSPVCDAFCTAENISTSLCFYPFSCTCGSDCFAVGIESAVPLNCTVPPAPCGFNQTFTDACARHCIAEELPLDESGQCDQACREAHLWPYVPNICPPLIPPPAPCGFSDTLTRACLSTCEGGGDGCVEWCRLNGIWPYNTNGCNQPQPVAPCGFSDNLTPNCTDYCNDPVIALNGTECIDACNAIGIWPTEPLQCPAAIPPEAPCGFSQTLTSNCTDYCNGPEIALNGTACIQSCLDAGIWPTEALQCPNRPTSSNTTESNSTLSSSSSSLPTLSATPPPAPCGFSDVLTRECADFCRCGPEGCLSERATITCTDRCLLGGIWPFQAQLCSSTSTTPTSISDLNSTIPSPTPSVTPPAAPCGFSDTLTPECENICRCGPEGCISKRQASNCSQLCLQAGVWPTMPLECPLVPSATPPPAPCGFSDTLTADCSTFCECGSLSCISKRQNLNTTDCPQRCQAAGIWALEPLSCSTSSSSLLPGMNSTSSSSLPPGISSSSFSSSTSIVSSSTFSSSFSSSFSISPGNSSSPTSSSSDSSSSFSSSSIAPSTTPSTTPSITPSTTPSITPSNTPSNTPSTTSSITPSITPSIAPSITPSISISISSSIASPIIELSSFSQTPPSSSSSSESIPSSPSTQPIVPIPATISILSSAVAQSPSLAPSIPVDPISNPAAPSSSGFTSVPAAVLVPGPSFSLSAQSNGISAPPAVPTLFLDPPSPESVPLAPFVPQASGSPNPQFESTLPVNTPPILLASPPPVQEPPVAPAAANDPPTASPVPSQVAATPPGAPTVTPIPPSQIGHQPPNTNSVLPTPGSLPPAPLIQSEPFSLTPPPNPPTIEPSLAFASLPTVPPNGESNGGGGGSGGSGGGGGAGGAPLQVAIYTFPTSQTFLGGYLPIIAARFFQMAWTSIHSHITDLEPFSQLARPGGATGTILLGADFSSTWYSWIAYSAVWTITPFAAEVISFDTNYGCANPNLNMPNNPCWPPRMSVNLWVIHLLQGLLGLVALMTLVAMATWFRKPSGCSAEPTSIASVAAVMGHPEVVRDFQSLDPEATQSRLKEFLKNKRYALDLYIAENGAQRYGIVPVHDHQYPAGSDRSLEEAPAPMTASSNAGSTLGLLATWKNFSTYADGIFVLFLVGILAICASYVKDVNKSRLAKLFEGSSVGRRLFFAVIGSVAASNWGRLQRDTQSVSPYLALARQEARPNSTILLTKHTTPFTAFFPSIRNAHFTAALVAFTALLSEFLVVAISGLPYRPGQLQDEFFFCGISSLIILAIMLMVIGSVNLWRRYLPHLPRKPDSAAAVMTYVCDSKMNDDFEGIERVEARKRNKWITELGKRYEYGLSRRRDGRLRWTVDESEKYGYMH